MVFTWQYPNHRFLAGLTISLTPLDGADANKALTATAGSVKGQMAYDVPTDAKSVQLVIEVKSPLVPILLIKQKYTISRDPGRRPEVMADGSSMSKIFEHPRLRTLGFSTGTPGTAICKVPVDLLFLDVTEHARSLPTSGNEPNARFQRAEEVIKAGNSNPTKIRVLEFTGGRPSVWNVLLPPALQPKMDQGVLLFFKNETPSRSDSVGVSIYDRTDYTNTDDADFFYGLQRYWPSPHDVGKYIQRNPSTTLPYFDHYPAFGWDKQLRDSNRSVIVLFPIPHNVDFGVLDSPGDETPGILKSALVCLFCDGGVKTGTTDPPGIRQLAVGGWSSGTDTLFRWVTAANAKNTKLRVDEFWIFDGKLGMKADVRGWITADSSRRLRLIGTAYTEVESNGLKSAKGGSVLVRPGNPKYWYENQDYKGSLAPSGSTAPFRFRHKPTDPPLPFDQDASTRSNIYIEEPPIVDHGTSVDQAIFLTSPGLGRHQIAQMSNEEAATFVVYEALKRFTNNAPVSTAGELASICSWIDRRKKPNGKDEDEAKISFRHRHPWSTIGGDFNPFIGYFQLCLRESEF
jgi:hypothetical protein